MTAKTLIKKTVLNLNTKPVSNLQGETSIYIQTNSNCNQKCIFCNRPPKNSYNNSFQTSLVKIKKKISILANDPTCKRIIFTGGEPLLYLHLLEVIHYAKGCHFIVEIQTNGTLLSLNKLKDLKKAGLDIINFACHSHKKNISNQLRGVDFGYESIIQNIKFANKVGFDIHIIHVVNQLNYQDIPGFIDFVHDLHIKKLTLNLSIVVPDGWAWENQWIIPRLSDIKPYLQKAMRKCVDYNIPFDVSEVVPLCIMQGFETHTISTTFKIKNTKITDDYLTGKRDLNFSELDSARAIKAPQCQRCSVNEICAGFYPRMKELYGVKDFKPRKDNPQKLLKKFGQ
ncbi:MAG TPA: radical SAM protein [Candidatus Paceibacterota bacterium]|mgnify:CR=1 FL=1|nr:radical SAM protein [Candidatus Paceibacterota bacterium]HPR91143.1 radical SAM protein [Candidatus Paceibacterota bacterium]